jgi:hypothetical protein
MYDENKENLCFSSKSFQQNQHIPPSRTPLAPIQINLNTQKPISLQKRKKPPIQRLGRHNISKLFYYNFGFDT